MAERAMPNLPNLLTLSRILLLPVILALLYYERQLGPFAAWSAFGIYVFVALTDFFDGWLARKWNQITPFGTFLDPIADKIFVGVMLVAFAGLDRLNGYWMIPALIIIAREFLVSGLREYLGPYNVKLPVTQLAKWKTTVQMLSIAFLIIGFALPGAMDYGRWLLTFAAVLTVITARGYLKAGLDHMRKIP